MKNYYFVFNSLFLDTRFCIVKESDMKEFVKTIFMGSKNREIEFNNFDYEHNPFSDYNYGVIDTIWLLMFEDKYNILSTQEFVEYYNKIIKKDLNILETLSFDYLINFTFYNKTDIDDNNDLYLMMSHYGNGEMLSFNSKEKLCKHIQNILTQEISNYQQQPLNTNEEIDDFLNMLREFDYSIVIEFISKDDIKELIENKEDLLSEISVF